MPIGIEALTVTVLTLRPGHFVQRICSGSSQPLTQLLRNEFRAIVRSTMLADSVRDYRIVRHSRVYSSAHMSRR